MKQCIKLSLIYFLVVSSIFAGDVAKEFVVGGGSLLRRADKEGSSRIVSGQSPQKLDDSKWTNTQSAHQAWLHEIRGTGGAWLAYNPEQRWTTSFDGHGFLAKASDSTWTWGLEFRKYGVGEQWQLVSGSPLVKVSGQQIAYDWSDTLQEWFLNDGNGLEHGFKLLRRPEGPADAPLSFVLATRGSLSAKVTSGSRSVGYCDASGAVILTYSGLKAWDALGRELGTKFVLSNGGVEVQVDAAGALYPLTIDPIAQQAYLKSSNTGSGDWFGYSVAISGDTAVVGAPNESSAASGVNGNQGDDASGVGSGAVYVFVRNGTSWVQQAYLKASTNGNWPPTNGDGLHFGSAVAISGDTIVVGAERDQSKSKGVNGNQINGSLVLAGAAYVFVRNGTTWSQQAYLKASNTDAGDAFGSSVAISGDTVVVGAPGESSHATGINGDQSDNSAPSSGAAYVFMRNGTTWTQQAYLKASNAEGVGSLDNGDFFGVAVAVSGDTVVVGASLEDSNAKGVDGNQTDNSSHDSGAAYVFIRNSLTWSQQAYLKASNTSSYDHFGISVAISGDTLVVGAPQESSIAIGVNSNLTGDFADFSGAAYIFKRNGTTWSQQAYLKASNSRGGFSSQTGGIMFGWSVCISGDMVAVGAPFENSNATGIDGNQADQSAFNAGAVYVFTRNGSMWAQQSYLKGSNTKNFDLFGHSVAVSAETMLVGARSESSSATGFNGNQDDNSALYSGAAYAFVGHPLSSDTNLTSLNLSSSTLNPAFESGISSYQCSVGNEVNALSLTPVASWSGATIKVRANGGAYFTIDSGTTTNTFALSVGNNTIDVNVTAEDGTTSKTYTILLTRDPGGDPVTLDVVAVGDQGNGADSDGFGAVGYAYAIGRYEVTISQYANFLNSVARRNTNNFLVNLWNPQMSSDGSIAGISRNGSGTPSDPYSYSVIGSGNRPIAYISWFDAARFVNWLHNGGISGASAETGAYTLNGATNGTVPIKNAGATWWIPTEDEWYKAAYYKGNGINAGYWLYPTRSNAVPANVIGSGVNRANFNNGVYSITQVDNFLGPSSSQNYITDVGAFIDSASAYGTFDQGGNLYEWNDLTATIGGWRGLRGGWWGESEVPMQSSSRYDNFTPVAESSGIGFRVACEVNDYTALSTLLLNRGTMSPVFASMSGMYSATVDIATSSITLTPTAARAGSSIQVRVNGGAYSAVASGSPSAPLLLNPGLNRIEVRVSSQNGLVARVYSVLVGRGNSNADLNELVLNGGMLSPVFNSSTPNYTAKIGSLKNWITVLPAAAQASATIQVRVNGGAYANLTSGSTSSGLALNTGSNTVELKVTAEDGISTKTYVINAMRAFIDTVPIGDEGNSADTTGYGAVSYPYRIGSYEVTISQYCSFLNSVANVPSFSYHTNLWNSQMASNLNVAGINRSGDGTQVSPYIYTPVGGGNRPIAIVNWFNAARFCNWLHNGATTGSSTETGAYTLSGATSGMFTRNVDAKWWIPSEDEWYKAAYYKGGSTNAGYWRYPTRSDTAPGNAVGGSPNEANILKWNPALYAAPTYTYSVTQSVDLFYDQNYLADVGAYTNSPSAYGTFDQGGSLWEWTDAALAGGSHSLRGGSWTGYDTLLQSSYRIGVAAPVIEYSDVGFRVAGAFQAEVTGNNSALTGLTLTGANLNPSFDTAIYSYSASVSTGTMSATLIPVAADINATIRVNGMVVASGSTSEPVALNVGINAITIAVVSQDSSSSSTYVVYVTRLTASYHFSTSTYSVNETDGYATLAIIREGDITDTGSVLISTINGTAASGSDYTGLSSQKVNFVAGQSSQTVNVPLVNHFGAGNSLSFAATLSVPASGASLLAPATTTVTIYPSQIPGTVGFETGTYTVNQGTTSITLTVTRSGGAVPFDVTIHTSDGLASTNNPPFSAAVAGTDYTALSGNATTLHFGQGTTSKAVILPLTPMAIRATVNRRLTATLSSPTSGAVLGLLSSTTAQILATDTTGPTVVINVPTERQSLVTRAATVSLIGTAFDAHGIGSVTYSLNGSASASAALGSVTSSTAGVTVAYNATLNPINGSNTLVVKATDLKGNLTTTATRSFTYHQLSTLTLSRTVPTANSAAPDNVGNVTAVGAVLAATANLNPKTADVQLGGAVSLTPSSRTGFMFKGWSFTPSVSYTLGTANKVTFAMVAGLRVNAEWVKNPYVEGASTYTGLVKAHSGTAVSNSTEGFVRITLTSSGSFTGQLYFDGQAHSFTGSFDAVGASAFGTASASTLSISRSAAGKPSLLIDLMFNAAVGNNQITGTLSAGTAVSDLVADKAAYSAASPVPNSLLNVSATPRRGYYTIAYPSKPQTPVRAVSSYPQGDGYAIVTLLNTGAVTVNSFLADGTIALATSQLVAGNHASLFTQILTPGSTTLKNGSFGGTLTFNITTDSDVTGADLKWFRPALSNGGTAAKNLYTDGWPDGVCVDAIGAQYNSATSIVTALGLNLPDVVNGNAKLLFSNGKLSAPITETKFNIAPTSNLLTKIPVSDVSYTLLITGTAGTFTGTFTPVWISPLIASSTKPLFSGVILQKGHNARGYGYFISNAVADVDPETGSVSLSKPD